MARCSIAPYPCGLSITVPQKNVFFCSCGWSFEEARSANYEVHYISEHHRSSGTIFGRYGLPKQLVSNNGSQLFASEFVHFLRSIGVKHIRSASYNLSSSGQADGLVQKLKKSLKASENDGSSCSRRLAKFLLSYRSTPHVTTILPVNCS